MKAIIFVSPSSAYGAYNGKTFNVLDFYGNGSKITLMLPGRGVDFTFSEVAIVDIEAELKTAYDNRATSKHYEALINYCRATGIQYVKHETTHALYGRSDDRYLNTPGTMPYNEHI